MSSATKKQKGPILYTVCMSNQTLQQETDLCIPVNPRSACVGCLFNEDRNGTSQWMKYEYILSIKTVNMGNQPHVEHCTYWPLDWLNIQTITVVTLPIENQMEQSNLQKVWKYAVDTVNNWKHAVDTVNNWKHAVYTVNNWGKPVFQSLTFS